MMITPAKPQSHVIQRSRLNIRVAKEKNAYEIQNLVVQTFQAEVLPLLEAEFDRWVPVDQVIQLDRLELNLGRISLENLKSALPRAIGDRLRELMPQVLSGGGKDIAEMKLGQQSSESSMLAALVRFLETGRLGWEHGHEGQSPRQWLGQLLESAPVALRAALSSVLRDSRAVERLCLQFIDAQVGDVLRLMIDDTALADRLIAVQQQTVGQLAQLGRFLSLLPQVASRQRAAVFGWLLLNWEALSNREVGVSSPPELVVRTLQGLVETGRLSWVGLASNLGQLESVALIDVLKLLSRQVEVVRGGESLPEETMSASAHPLRRLILMQVQEPERVSQNVWEEMVIESVPASRPGLQEEVIGLLRVGGLDASAALGVRQNKRSGALGNAVEQPRSSAVKPSSPVEAHSKSRVRLPDDSGNLFAEDGGIYIQNAGLVLLNPFLQPCFEDLGWMERGEFVSDEARENAVLFTAYLASGESEIAEPQLPLAKLLCGMDLGEPVRMALDLPERALAEADTLLTAANEHWKRAGKLSPAQFREAFLVREGRLEAQGAGWSLKVDRHTIDILLEFLPWSFGTIKLPWMNGLLSVDW